VTSLKIEKRQKMVLTANDKERLERLAVLFDIQFSRQSFGTYKITVLKRTGDYSVELSQEIAHFRLLSEICSCCVNWVYFHVGESCKDSLLNLTDAKLERIAELFALARDSGKPV
jgi:hypothetical protein